jgi:hypothetical protein
VREELTWSMASAVAGGRKEKRGSQERAEDAREGCKDGKQCASRRVSRIYMGNWELLLNVCRRCQVPR